MRLRGRRVGICLWVVGCLACSPRPGELPVPEEIARRNSVGAAYLSQGELKKAEAVLREALAERPGDPVLLVNLALAILRGSEPQAAEALLRQALAQDPGSLHAHYVLGLIEKDRGAFEAALEHLDRVAAIDPQDVATQYQRGTVLSRLARPREAEAAFRIALERDPDHVSALYGLGRLLIQEGRDAEGETLLRRSQEVKARSGLDTAMGLQYGEQGPYAMAAEYPAGGLAAGPAIPLSFVPGTSLPLAAPGTRIAAAVGMLDTGPCAFVCDARGTHLLRDGVPAQLLSAAAGGETLALAVGDIDGDGKLELLALRAGSDSLDVEIAGHPFTLASHLERNPSNAALALVDTDHDGDLDLFACWSGAAPATDPTLDPSRCRLAVNDGSGRFTVAQRSVGLALEPRASAGTIAVGFSDLDNDRDVDLVVVEADAVHLFSNQRDGTFTDVSAGGGLGAVASGATSFAIADLDKDSFMDLVLGGAGGPRIAWNRRGRFEAPRAASPERPLETSAADRPGVVVLDADLDGFLDLAASAGGSLVLWRNLGRGEFSPKKLAAGAGAPLAAFDADSDGDPDILVAGEGAVAILRNDGGNANRWVAIQPRGLRDNRFGIGTKVEVLAGALRQKFEVTSPLPLRAGLGSRPGADAIRLLWPGGVLQDEVDFPAGTSRETVQLDRKGTSCPLLYAWRDGHWRFVTDFLGGCAIGYRHAPGVLNVPDTDEYVLLEDGLTSVDGELRLRFNNQLEEVLWFDEVELVVADHPQGTELYPNERLMAGPPWPEFQLFASADVRAIRGARELTSGQDVTELLAARDRATVEGFQLLPFKGYAEKHTLELDLGSVPARERIVLLLDGWIDYADSTSNIAASQAGVSLLPPVLFVPDGRGGWREAPGRMGFPAGLPKTMSVDLTGALRAEDPRVRIETSMRIYWDRARVLVGGEELPVEITRIAPRSAELRFGGYPVETSPDGKPPYAYDPDRVLPSAPWKAHSGAYTPFGDVTELLSKVDDRFVTTRGGDEVELRFPAPPPPRAGWTRTYLLYADGFGKDMDPNSAASDEVGPIPFHGMPLYPYGPQAVPPHLDAGSVPLPRIVPPSATGLPGVRPLTR